MMFIDIDCVQQKKYGQNICGDDFLFKRYADTDRLIAILSDGLGSGVKANILACMTSVMLLKFIEAKLDIQQACEIIINSLPICQIRKISYATFTAIDCSSNGAIKIIEEGNPELIWIRDNSNILAPVYDVVTAKHHPNRQMRIYNIEMQKNDRLIFCSDGVTQAGLGSKNFPLGLKRDGLIDIILKRLKDNPEISSRDLSRYIVGCIQTIEPNREVKDDVSVMSAYYRNSRQSLIFTGPPYNPEQDNFYVQMLWNFIGKKAICGGATVNLVSRELGVPIKTKTISHEKNISIVPCVDGIDLITEGILTLTMVCEHLDNGAVIDGVAESLVEFLLNSDHISFLVGIKLNQAHFDPRLSIEIGSRKSVVQKIANLLETKYAKKVVISYI